MSTMNKDLIYEVLSVVEEIPEGRVATYGQIARLTGRDRNARMIGKILSISAYYGQYPPEVLQDVRAKTELTGFSAIKRKSQDLNMTFFI